MQLGRINHFLTDNLAAAPNMPTLNGWMKCRYTGLNRHSFLTHLAIFLSHYWIENNLYIMHLMALQ